MALVTVVRLSVAYSVPPSLVQDARSLRLEMPLLTQIHAATIRFGKVIPRESRNVPLLRREGRVRLRDASLICRVKILRTSLSCLSLSRCGSQRSSKKAQHGESRLSKSTARGCLVMPRPIQWDNS